jgi:tRNA-dihydrouridine synthase
MYKGEADWTLIGKVKDNPRIHIPIFGNGDVDSPQKAQHLLDTYGVDGLMIGRASIGYPWIFREVKHFLQTGELHAGPELSERVEMCRIHFQESIRWKGERTGVFEMRRHYANYFKGIPHFKPFRMRLVEAMNPSEIMEILEEISCLKEELIS